MCLAFVRGSGTPGLLDGLQRPDDAEEITGLGLVALRGDSDVLHVVCGRYGRRRREGHVRGRRGRKVRRRARFESSVLLPLSSNGGGTGNSSGKKVQMMQRKRGYTSASRRTRTPRVLACLMAVPAPWGCSPGRTMMQTRMHGLAVAEMADFPVEVCDIMSYCDIEGWEKL